MVYACPPLRKLFLSKKPEDLEQIETVLMSIAKAFSLKHENIANITIIFDQHKQQRQVKINDTKEVLLIGCHPLKVDDWLKQWTDENAVHLSTALVATSDRKVHFLLSEAGVKSFATTRGWLNMVKSELMPSAKNIGQMVRVFTAKKPRTETDVKENKVEAVDEMTGDELADQLTSMEL